MPAAHSAAAEPKPSSPRAWPLRWLLYLFALALIAPLLGFGIFTANQMIIAERAAEEEDLRRAARMLSAAIDRELSRLTELLQALAESGSLKDGDLDGFHRESSAAVRGTGHAIQLVDRALDQIIDTRVPFGTPLLPVRDPDTARKVFATSKPAIGDLIMSRLAQRRVVSVMVPALVDGEVRYVLVLWPDSGTVSWILERQDLPAGWLARVSDRNNRILARSARHHEFLGEPAPADTQAKETGRSGVVTTQDHDGNPVLHAYVSSEVSGWRTAVWVPLSILEAPARRLWRGLVALAVVTFAVSLLSAALLGRWLARPIAGVANAAAALGRGDPVGYAPCAVAEVNAVGATLATAAEQRRQAESALKESEQRLRLALDHTRFLMRELSHRTKNVMAVVQAISWQTAQKSSDLEDFEQRFSQRLEALARSHDFFVKREWQGIMLEDLVRAQLEPFLDSAEARLATRGPALMLVPGAAQDLGLALHELATNASKYGALSEPTGKIEIGWSVDGGTAGAPRFCMTWCESGGPIVSPPVRKGFGCTVITAALSRSFNGESKLEFKTEGLRWELTAPSGSLIAKVQPH